MSVCSAISRPSRVAFHGVSGAGFRTTVLPVARAWPSLLIDDLEREVPRHDRADDADRLPPDLSRVVFTPVSETIASPSDVSHGYSSISLAG